MTVSPAQEVVRFGLFELDLAAGQLTRQGSRLRLPQQPLQLLAVLLERPGEILTREELRRRLWPSDVFVDFDHGLNKSIQKLRDALGDAAGSPRYIETIPRVGYRFIAPVSNENKLPTGVVEPATAPPLPALESKASSLKPRWWMIVAAAGVVAVCAIAGLSLHKQRSEIRSLAILPLENLSNDAAQDYLADGMTGELITSLGQIGDLRVISQTTAMRYKHSDKPLSQIAQELHVDAILDGSVFRSGEKVRIDTQLVDAREDRQIWAQSYQGDFQQLLGLQNQVAGAVAEQIRLKLTARKQTRLNDVKPVNPQAYESYLKGQFYFEVNSLPASQSALAYSQRAVELDPQFARAWVGVARAYNMIGEGGVPAGEAAAGADAAVAKALLLEPDMAEAYSERAWTLMYYHSDFPGTERDFRHALALDPKRADAHEGLADYYLIMGRFDDSIAELDRASELSPASPVMLADSCLALNFARRYDEAVAKCSAALDLDPNYHWALYILQQVYDHQHNFDLAENIHMRLGIKDAGTLAMLRETHGAPGVKGAFDRWLKRQTTMPDPYALAVAYSGLGRKDLAFASLQKAFEQRTSPHKLTWVHLDPNFDALHSDPRFEALLRRFGLPMPPPILPAQPGRRNKAGQTV